MLGVGCYGIVRVGDVLKYGFGNVFIGLWERRWLEVVWLVVGLRVVFVVKVGDRLREVDGNWCRMKKDVLLEVGMVWEGWEGRGVLK